MNGVWDQALWALGRGTGVAALVLMTVSLVLGILSRSGRQHFGLARFGINEVHRTAALTAVGLVATHVVSLLFDPYAQLRLVDTFFPFLGNYRGFWLGLGTLAIDLLAVVTVVSLLRDRVGPTVFRAVHWATYALWPVALLHSLGTGTDAWSLWFDVVVVACVGTVAGVIWWRLGPEFEDRGWSQRRIARKVAR